MNRVYCVMPNVLLQSVSITTLIFLCLYIHARINVQVHMYQVLL